MDFLPFQPHPKPIPHCLKIHLTLLIIFTLLCETIQRRFVTLREADVSTWGRLPGADPSAPPPAPHILDVMDEFANLADALPTNERRELWPGARMIDAEGRKAGVHLALALQDPPTRV